LKRLVVDASTLVSGIASPHGESPPCLIYDALTEASFDAILCPQLLDEIERALRKPYFRDLLEEREISEIVATIRDAGIVLNDPVDPPALLRDPNDDYLIALAREADAAAIVTGDRDLLDHAGLEPPALQTRAACELLGLL
jgi:uncharacterized protein